MNTGPLAGQTIVFTGAMKKTRFEMESDAHRLGAYTEPRVTRRTTILVTGKRPGKTKLNAAQSYGTETLTEAEYERAIQTQTAALNAANAHPEPVVEEPAERPPEPEWAKNVRTARSLNF